jgi:iron complex outermembrane receptor protein
MDQIQPRFSAVLLAISAAFPLVGQAQTQSDDAPIQLEEVIVTANRRAQNLQEVPMSVSAFTGDFFKETGVRNLAELQAYTPSLKIQTSNDSRGTSIRIRGIGSVGTNSGIDPSVGVFIDGVYQGRAGMTVGDLVDIERVEVLRGPQGTLYGKNTSAGAISISTKQPSAEFEADLEYSFDNDERSIVRGMINVPFGESGHAMRLTGFGNYGDHIYENTFPGAESGKNLNNTNRWGTKGRFLFDFDAVGEFLLTLDYSRDDTDCCAMSVISYDGLSTLNSPLLNGASDQSQLAYGLAVPPEEALEGLSPNYPGYRLQYTSFEDSQGFSPPEADPFDDKYWFDGPLKNEVEVGGVALEWNRELPRDHELAFINAWRHYESDSTFDGDFSGYDATGGLTDVDLNQYSSELRIASASGQKFEYQGGLYYYYSKFDSLGQFKMGVPLVTAINLGFLFPDGSLNTDDNTYTTTSYAAFGQLVWNLSEKWSATLGLRWTRETKGRDGSQITEGVSPAFDTGNGSFLDIPPVAGPNVYYDNERDDSDVSPTLNIRYFATEDLMTYASISRGFKSGGFDQRRVPADESGEFEDETSTSYELGWKGTWYERRLQVNGTFFYVDYDDFQSQTFDGSSFKVTNAGTMESYGMEVDAIFAASTDLILGTAVGYTKATYKKFDRGQCRIDQAFEQFFVEENAQYQSPASAGGTVGLPPLSPPETTVCIQDLAGEDVDNSPEWTVSNFMQYNWQVSEDLVTIFRAEYNYIDSFFLDQDLDPNLKNDAVNLVNLRATLTNLENTWEVALWGRNILNEEYFAFGIDIPTVGGYGAVNAPDMSYGLTLRYQWY